MIEKQWAEKLFACIDATTLNATDNESTVAIFCRRMTEIEMEGAKVASVCVYPRFVSVARQSVGNSGLRVVSVAGAFPHGQLPIALKKAEAKYAVDAGADEVDMVISRGLLLGGNDNEVRHEVEEMKQACNEHTLKTILETGELPSPTLVAHAARLAIAGGADFIKTSTGKIAVGATIEAAEAMLKVIRDHYDHTGHTVGFKAAGGIRKPEDALAYAQLAADIMGSDYITPATFRIGASSLVDSLLSTI